MSIKYHHLSTNNLTRVLKKRCYHTTQCVAIISNNNLEAVLHDLYLDADARKSLDYYYNTLNDVILCDYMSESMVESLSSMFIRLYNKLDDSLKTDLLYQTFKLNRTDLFNHISRRLLVSDNRFIFNLIPNTTCTIVNDWGYSASGHSVTSLMLSNFAAMADIDLEDFYLEHNKSNIFKNLVDFMNHASVSLNGVNIKNTLNNNLAFYMFLYNNDLICKNTWDSLDIDGKAYMLELNCSVFNYLRTFDRHSIFCDLHGHYDEHELDKFFIYMTKKFSYVFEQNSTFKTFLEKNFSFLTVEKLSLIHKSIDICNALTGSDGYISHANYCNILHSMELTYNINEVCLPVI